MPKALEGRREEGFTLVELMMVVLIVAIVIAIAMATFPATGPRTAPRRPTCATTYLKNTACDQPSAPTGGFTTTGWQ